MIDLVVCAHGNSPYLAECLRSLAEQLAVRDGLARITVATSTPSEYIESAARGHGARYMVNDQRLGIGEDWNFAMRCGDAPLVAICHQDDLYEPTFATRMLDLFEQHPGLSMASSSYAEIDAGGRSRRSLVRTAKKFLMWNAFRGKAVVWGPAVHRRMLAWGCPICCPSVVFNRQALSDFRFDTQLRCCLDWDAWDRIARQPGLIGYLEAPLLRHRVHGGSTTSASIGNTARSVEDLAMLQRFWSPTLAAAWHRVYSQAERAHGGAGQSGAPANPAAERFRSAQVLRDR